MYFRRKIFGHRIVFYNRKVHYVTGVNSKLKDDLHICMLDIDEANIIDLIIEVQRLQKKYKLGYTTIYNTGRKNSYHVYFWNKLEFLKALSIACDCDMIDSNYIKFSAIRGNFTLRITDKKNRSIQAVMGVGSEFQSDVTPKDLESFTSYETAYKPEDT